MKVARLSNKPRCSPTLISFGAKFESNFSDYPPKIPSISPQIRHIPITLFFHCPISQEHVVPPPSSVPMADIEPPSFSLGLDFDLDFDLPRQTAVSPTPDTSAPPEENNESLPVTDSRPDSPPPSIFRRLRRGLPTKIKEAPVLSRVSEDPFPDSIEDDIEEFSPEEIAARSDKQTAPQLQSVCSGTKFSLRGQGVVIKQAPKKPNIETKQVLDPPSTSSVTRRGMPILPDVTMSPLRRFQLIDSDSDDMSDHGHSGLRSGIKVTNKRESNISSSTAADGKISVPSSQCPQKVDLWKDFLPKENGSISTPVLDEYCQDYFRTPKDTKSGPDAMRKFCENQGGVNKRARVDTEKIQQTDPGHAFPPAHCYFFHDDTRIQTLVQSRLCHFQPLFLVNNAGIHQHYASTIDYRGQFNNESRTKQTTGTRAKPQTVSRKTGNSSKRTRGKGTTNSTEEWINPKTSVSTPKDANRRRVHASGGSVGQWRTEENGKKVYVSKSGQEFSGQSAYRCYKKESGSGFRKSKKKPAARRKK